MAELINSPKGGKASGVQPPSLLPDYKKQGKANRAAGKRFELKVRQDLESKGWIVFRNSNDVIDEKFKQTTGHWNPFTHSIMTAQSGFPDFICIKAHDLSKPETYQVKFVECKLGKYLDKKEKEKCRWIIDKLYIKVMVAYKGDKRGEIIYEDFI